MLSNKKILAHIDDFVDYCNDQKGCQNCIFRKHGASRWYCWINIYDLKREVESNIAAKKKGHGYI